ncbi:hypothetical protein Tco_0084271 [Tanacetum coccineum]
MFRKRGVYWLSANEIASQASKSATPVTHVDGLYTEKLSALTSENTKLKALVHGKTSSGPTTSEKPKVLASGMYTKSSKYIPPPKRASGKHNPLPKKSNLQERQNPAMNVSQKPMPESTTLGNHPILAAVEEVNARRAADHNRKLHVVDHNQFIGKVLVVDNGRAYCGALELTRALVLSSKVTMISRFPIANLVIQKAGSRVIWSMVTLLLIYWKERIETTRRLQVQDRLQYHCLSGYSKENGRTLGNSDTLVLEEPSLSRAENLSRSSFNESFRSQHAHIHTTVSEVIKKVFIQGFRTISENQCLLQILKVTMIGRRDIIKAFKDSNRYEHVRLKISVWQSQSERRSQSNSEK